MPALWAWTTAIYRDSLYSIYSERPDTASTWTVKERAEPGEEGNSNIKVLADTGRYGGEKGQCQIRKEAGEVDTGEKCQMAFGAEI